MVVVSLWSLIWINPHSTAAPKVITTVWYWEQPTVLILAVSQEQECGLKSQHRVT